ncbi:hypothetical protein TNCT_155521 [Trichonephila clavata]|uniref:Uncharacterized protein n=1 Tax=Trichonephila clavata TaxID=2740835 RepID=A0A8X6GVP8_TRICU|nr:hypothetical protein TNCT_155521 [Trichonephila clavata]
MSNFSSSEEALRRAFPSVRRSGWFEKKFLNSRIARMISEHDEFWVLEAESGSERFIAGSDPVSRADLWWPILAAFAYELFEVIWF